MKKQSFTFALVAMLTVAFSACSVEENINEYAIEARNIEAPVTAALRTVETKAGEISLKPVWNDGDMICIYNNDVRSYYIAQENKSVSEFEALDNNVENLEGHAIAFFPKSVNMKAGKGTFSLAGQKGNFDELSRYTLMSANATVNSESRRFPFNDHLSVIDLDLRPLLAGDNVITGVSLKGEGVSETISIDATDGFVNVKAADSNGINLTNLYTTNDNLAIALLPTSDDIEIHVYDNLGGDFTCRINGSALRVGTSHRVTTVEWDGGYAIEF